MPEIPQNTGTIIRMCSAFDLTLYIIHPCGFIWDSKFLKRSAMDYIHKVNIVHLYSFDELIKLNLRMILAICDIGHDYYTFEYNTNDVILFGQESIGLPDHIKNSVKHSVSITMNDQIRSLNLAISVAIITGVALGKINQKIH